jgi:hypothetical protein
MFSGFCLPDMAPFHIWLERQLYSLRNPRGRWGTLPILTGNPTNAARNQLRIS